MRTPLEDRPDRLDYPAMLAALVDGGVSVAAALARPSISVTLDRDAPGACRLKVSPAASNLQVVELLRASGMTAEATTEGGVVVDGRNLAHNLLLQFELPFRLPTLNPQLRMHWSTKRKELLTLAWEIHAAIPRAVRPAVPLTGIEVEIDRYGPQRPDDENLKASAKWLLDVMQPVHEKKRPYGLGVILEDAKSCVHELRVHHVKSNAARTTVRIYQSSMHDRSAQP